MVKQCCATDGVEPQYIKDDILPAFFKFFWNQRMALDRRNYRQVSKNCSIFSFIWPSFGAVLFVDCLLYILSEKFPEITRIHSFYKYFVKNFKKISHHIILLKKCMRNIILIFWPIISFFLKITINKIIIFDMGELFWCGINE